VLLLRCESVFAIAQFVLVQAAIGFDHHAHATGSLNTRRVARVLSAAALVVTG
jgi:hypothetical protein